MTEQPQDIWKIDTSDLSAGQILQAAAERFGDRLAFASSLGAEDQVLTDIICRQGGEVTIFTLDTGRLPQETYDLIEQTNEKYDIRIKLMFPDKDAVETMVNEHGPNLFYNSVALRKRCCYVRKVEPLRRALAGLDAWITGQRREQSLTRARLNPVEWDESHGMVKINPLADWTHEQVWDYIQEHDVPYNKLHDCGYPSIGCAPCTRAVNLGEDIRAGRWWWEQPEHKECGLHIADDKLRNKEE